jgi:ABC-2 type transport system permease protein
VKSLLAQTKTELLLTMRRGDNLLVIAFIPAALLAFFSLVPALPIDEPRVQHLLPRMLAVAVMATAMTSLGIATGYERHYRILKRLGATPLTRGQLIAAKIAAVLLIELFQIVVLVVIALLLGWHPSGVGAGVIAAWVLSTSAFAGIGLFLAGRLRAEMNLALTNALFLFFLLLGGALVPTKSLPAGLATFAELLPSSASTSAFQWSFGQSSPMPSLIVLGVWAIVAPVLAAFTFSWD